MEAPMDSSGKTQRSLARPALLLLGQQHWARTSGGGPSPS